MAKYHTQVDGIEYDIDPASVGGNQAGSSNPKLSTGRKLGMFGIAGNAPSMVLGDQWYDSTNGRFMCVPKLAGTPGMSYVGEPDAVLAADTGALSSTTAASITGLSFAAVANATYVVRAVIRATSSSTAGVKYAISAPASTVLTVGVQGNGATNNQTWVNDIIVASATLTTSAFQALAALGITLMQGVIKTAGTAGTVQLQYAKVTSGTVVFNAGSLLEARRVA